MLNEVLQAITNAKTPLSVAVLSRELGMERGALEGILAYWVRKGRLRDDDAPLVAEGSTDVCAGASCSTSCMGMKSCPFVARMPRTYSVSGVRSKEE